MNDTVQTNNEGSTRALGPCLRICHLNIEGISRSKCEFLQRVLTQNKIDVVAIQETHAESEDQLVSRGNIPGFEILGATYHRNYGVATYIRNKIENASLCRASTNNNIHEVAIKVGETTIVNIYKPPGCPWPPEVLQDNPHPSIYVGDFNSHHENWKYEQNDQNGESLMSWSEETNTHLIFDAKERGTFRSAAWRRDYNPDLCFVTKNKNNQPLAVSREVLSDFPHSQHRPVIIEVGVNIPIINSFPRPRWNFLKADWTTFAEDLDKCLGWIPPTRDSYDRFVGAVISTAKKNVPRGYRKEYVPGWNDRCENLYQEFTETNDREIADELLHSLDAARREKWMNTVENLDFSKSSRQAWTLLRNLGGSKRKLKDNHPITPNNVASHIVKTSRAPRDRTHTTTVKRELRSLKQTASPASEFSRPIAADEVAAALSKTKSGKAPGFDGIHPEFLLHCGKYARVWLAKFFTNILESGKIPYPLKRAKIIAILKPGKSNDMPQNYRPIALLNCVYKLLERIIYDRIGGRIFEVIPIEQAGFRPNRSCTDQILSLTTHMEAGFQKKLKTSVAFIDLSAAYDTVWRQGLICKLLRVIPCNKLATLIDSMLTDRSFKVIMGDLKSDQMKLNNGLPQGSVLAPLLFNLYISDLPETISQKFGYADDWAIAAQDRSMEATEHILTADLERLGDYFRRWRLRPNATKTEVTCFHLDNAQAKRKLNVHFENRTLNHNSHPKYLGVTLDRTLTFKEHLRNTAAKLKTRNNIIQKLCGTTWGSSAAVLRSSALGLVYSAAEYAAPVWLNSKHTGLIDVQLNHTMRMISGTIKPTPLHWLPVLSNIPPPNLRRENALLREYGKLLNNEELPIHRDVPALEINRLRSRHPPLIKAKNTHPLNPDINNLWKTQWRESVPQSSQNMPCIDVQPPGFDLPRKTWTTLNRIRTNNGRCADSLHRWGKAVTPECDCGADRQTIRHIVEDCPLRRFAGDPDEFLTATESAINYVTNLDVCL